MVRKHLCCILIAGLAGLLLAGPAAAGGLTKKEIQGLVQAGFEDAAIAKVIRGRGIAFQFDMNVAIELQRAGIGPLALKAIREATGGGSAKQGSAGAGGKPAGRLLFVLDASGSMKSSLGGQTRMQFAKKAFDQILGKIPAAWHVGLVVFAHRKGDCKDVELVQPVGPNQPEKLRQTVHAIEANGGTPLAYSLQQAGDHLKSFGKSGKKVVVLLSDGAETCGGDPVGVARALAASGIEAIVHTIGLAVTPGTAVQLKAIAAAGGGKYLDAQSGEALFRAMKEVVSEEALGGGAKSRGGVIRQGPSFREAPEVAPGTYRFGLKQKDGQFGYIRVKVPASYSCRITSRIPADWPNYYYNFNSGLYDGAHQQVSKTGYIGIKQGAVSHMWHAAELAQYFYYRMSVGKIGGRTNGDIRTIEFTITLSDRTDAGSSQDAPASWKKALAIKLGQKYKGWFLHGKDADVYAVSLKGGTRYVVRGTSENEGYEVHVVIQAQDEDGAAIGGATSKSRGFPAKLQLSPKADGKVYITIHRQVNEVYFYQERSTGGPIVAYSFSITAIE